MESDDENRMIRPGDLVVITSAFEPGEVMDCPPGLVLEVRMGVPSTGGPSREETEVCAILWRGFVDHWVDVEWLARVVDGGHVWIRKSTVRHEEYLEKREHAQAHGDDD